MMIQVNILKQELNKTLDYIESQLSSLDEEIKLKALLIIEEIITNQLRHAKFSSQEKKIITLSIEFQKDSTILLTFEDNAEIFNPLNAKNPDVSLALQERKLGGLGIFIIKKYAKNLSYTYKNSRNILKVEL